MTRGIQLLFLNVRVFTRLNLNVKEIGLSTVVGRVHYKTWLQEHSRSISLAELSTYVRICMFSKAFFLSLSVHPWSGENLGSKINKHDQTI